MKTASIFKKCAIATTTLFVCSTMAATGMSFASAVHSAKADGARAAATATQLFDGIRVDSECDYGKPFSVPVVADTDVTVKAPNNTTVELGAAEDNAYSITANQVGNYTVTYSKDGKTYDFRVYVSLDEEYFLKVDNNGADIPTYIAKNGSFVLPSAKIAYYDSDKILRSYPDSVIRITDSVGNTYKPGDTYNATQNGQAFITYSAEMGANGQKYFNQTFTVKVQSSFTDTAAPTLSVSGVSGDVSVNRAVTLPAATATDNYDENIKIEIKVIDPDGNRVRITDLDKNGFAYQNADKLAADASNDNPLTWNYPYVEFDNDKAMTFYPIKTGTYVITYTATDDAGNKAGERTFYMESGDLAAPVFTDIDEYMIPETWGLSVYNKANGTTPLANGGKVTFPVPTVVDNKDHAYPISEDDTDLISLYFRITDADNSKTIVEFSNILAASDSDDCKFKANSTYGDTDATYVFNKDNLFEFDFNKYHKTNSAGDVEDLPGTYTVYYRARDKANQTSSKTYTINLENEYTDKNDPTAAEVTVPTYISATDDTFDIPSPEVADAESSRLKTVYRIYSDNSAADQEGGSYISVNGGENAEFVTRGDARYLVINKDETYESALKLGNNLYFYVEVTDSVGNVKRNTTDNTAEYLKSEAVTKIVSGSGTAAYAYVGNIEFKQVSDGSDALVAGNEINAGDFTITTTAEMRKFTGFEITVTDPNGDYANVTLETFSSLDASNNKSVIYVKNIKFLASFAGDYTLSVCVSDVNGLNTVYSYSVTVSPSSSSGGSTSSAAIGTTGSVNVKYMLNNDVMKNIGEAGKIYYVVRKISGGVFSLMGSEITAKTQGTFTVTDGYIVSGDIGSYTDFETNATPYGANSGRYSFTITDTAAPVLEVLGVMPTYAEKNATVTLPSVIAHSQNGNADIEVVVTNPNSREITVDYDDSKGTYSFVGALDGAYTVTVTATYANASPVTATYTINVGDVVGPEFTVSGGTTGRMTVGDVFTFGKIVLADGESTSGVRITKKLYDPSREEVTDATVNGSYSTYKDYENNGTDIKFSMAGSYEVVYTVTDSVGNDTVYRYNITVVGSGSSTPTTITTLSTVLIVIAVVLLAGVIVYVVRFRKVKQK